MDLRLEKRDPATSQVRFYRLITMPNLFGGGSLVREWGRIGRPGQVKIEPYATEDEAAGAKLAASKRRRGYEPR
jgi:predicted DNA-binding WGR domain protein